MRSGRRWCGVAEFLAFRTVPRFSVLATMWLAALWSLSPLTAEAVVLPATANLQLWLDVDRGLTVSGTAVTGWADQSGKAHNATGTAGGGPQVGGTINGHAALSFTGSQTIYTNSPFWNTKNHEIFVVANCTNAGESDLLSTGSIGGAGTVLLMMYQNTLYRGHFWTGVSGTGVIDRAATPLVPSIYNQEFQSNTLATYWNGVRVNTWSGSSTNATWDVILGSRNKGGGSGWKGTVGEVLVYDVGMTAADRQRVENYLSGKWGIATPTSRLWSPSSDNANDAANWGGTLNSGDHLVFTGAAQTSPAFNADQAAAGIAFQNLATSSYTVGGSGTLTIGAGGLNNWSSAAQTINTPVVLGVDQEWTSQSARLTVAGSVSGAHALSTAGAGAVALTANNTYTLGTTVKAGKLLVNNTSGSGTGSGAVTVTGGALGGSGTVGGAVTVQANGHVAPGDGLGTLNVGALSLAANSILDWEFDTGASDLLAVGAGGLTINGGKFNLFAVGSTDPFFTIGDYTLMTYSGALSGNVNNLSVANAQPGMTYTFSDTGNSIRLSIGGVFVPIVWNGNGADAKWSNAANWGGSGIPAEGGPVKFGPMAGTQSTPNNDLTGKTYNELRFNADSSAYTLTGNSLTLTGPVNNLSASDQVINMPLALGAGAGTINSGDKKITVGGVISGGAGLTKTGNGVLVLSSGNNYTGATTLNAGTLQLSGGDNRIPPSQPLTVNGGTLDLGGTTIRPTTVRLNGGTITSGTFFYSDQQFYKSGAISANIGNTNFSARVWIGGDPAATVTLSGNNFYTFADGFNTIIGHATSGPAGTVKLGHYHALGGSGDWPTAPTQSTDVYAGTLDLNGQTNVYAVRFRLLADNACPLVNGNTSAEASFAGGVEITGTQSIGGDGELTLSGVVSGGTLRKIGSGTLTLSGPNTYGGATSVEAGTLRVNGSTSGAGPVTVADGATLGGSGSMAGAVSMAPGARIAPGAGVGTLTVAGLSLFDPTSVLDYEFSATANDLVNVTAAGGLVIEGGGMNLYQAGTTDPFATQGLYHVFQYTGTIGGTGLPALSVLNPQAGRDYSFLLSGTYVDLLISGGGTTWTGAAADDEWMNGENWGGTAPVPPAALTFGAPTGHASNHNNFAAGTEFGGITFKADAPSYDLKGNAIKLSGAVLNLSANDQTISLDMELASGIRTVNTGATNVTLAGALSGAGALSVSGSGALVLSHSNTYNGGTTVEGGTLKLGAAGALPPAGVTLSAAGALDLGGFDATLNGLTGTGAVVNNPPPALPGVNTLTVGAGDTSSEFAGSVNDGMSGITALTKTGAGAFTLSGTNSHTGLTTVDGGILLLNGPFDGTYHASTIKGNLVINAGGTVRQTRADQIGEASNVTINGGTYEAPAGAEGFDSLTMTGGSYASGSVVLGLGSGNQGKVTTGAASTTATIGGNIGFRGDNTFDVAAGSTPDGVDCLVTGLLYNDGAGGLIKTGDGKLVLANATNNYIGDTTVNAGTLQIGDGLTINGSVPGNITNNATLVAANPLAQSYTGIVSGTGRVVKSGAGTLTIGPNQAYGGTTTIAAGTLQLSPRPAISGKLLSTDVLNQGSAAGARYGDNYNNNGSVSTVELVRFIPQSGAAPLNISYNQAGDMIDFADFVAAGDTAGNLGSNIHGRGSVLFLPGDGETPGNNNGGIGLGAHANWLITFDLTDIRTAFFAGQTEPLSLTGRFGMNGQGNPGETVEAGNYVQGTIYYDGVLQHETAPRSVTDPSDPISLEIPTDVHYLTLAIVNGRNSTTRFDDGTFRDMALSLVGAPPPVVQHLPAGSAVLLASGATFDLNGNAETIGSLADSGTSGGKVLLGAGTLTTGGDGTSTKFSGEISGTGALVKTGAGVFTLSGHSDYSGGTTVSAGTLKIASAGALPSGRSLTIDAGGTVVLTSGLSAAGGSSAGSSAPVPEPGTLALLACAAALALAASRRRMGVKTPA